MVRRDSRKPGPVGSTLQDPGPCNGCLLMLVITDTAAEFVLPERYAVGWEQHWTPIGDPPVHERMIGGSPTWRGVRTGELGSRQLCCCYLLDGYTAVRAPRLDALRSRSSDMW